MATYTKNGMAVVNDVLTKYNGSAELTVPEGVVSIAADAFSLMRGDFTMFSLPSTLAKIDASAFSKHPAHKITVSSANRKFKVQSGCLIDVSTSTLVLASSYFLSGATPQGEIIRFLNGNSASNYLMPQVKYIGAYAFANCDGAGYARKAVTLPKGLVSIGNNAFLQAKIVGVVMPDSLTTIGSKAFAGTSLYQVEIPPSVTSIGDEAFRDCGYLSSIFIRGDIKNWGKRIFDHCGGNRQSDMYISSTSVGDNAIATRVTRLHLTTKLKSLGDNALGSPSVIYTHGTLAQWNSVRKGKGNNYPHIVCTDGKTGTGGFHL